MTDPSGNPVSDGNYQITFRLYAAEDDDIGDALWTETQTVSVNNGLFNVMLGADTTIPTELFVQKLWLGVEVDSDGEMTPRQQLTGAPYAMASANYAIQSTTGQMSIGPGSSANYAIGAGYWYGLSQRAFEIFLPLSLKSLLP